MIVHQAPWRSELTPAVTRITRVALADLLGSMGGGEHDQQAFTDWLRHTGAVTARVIETRADGVSVLELNNARVALRLPTAHAPGERVTIALDRSSLDDRALVTTPPAAAAVTLSPPAMLLSDIQKIVINQILVKTPAMAPALAMVAAEAAPPVLAEALQQVVRSSGLFYESHLRGWIEGRIALESLLAEPQARILQALLPGTDETQAPAPARLEPMVHPQLEPLVRQQLDTLERQRIAWNGDLWPGQPAEMLISREPAAGAETTAPRTWRVKLNLHLPTLGSVKVDMALTGRQLDVRLQGEGAAAQVLRDGRTALSLALAAHDLEVRAIQIAGTAQ